MVAATTSQPTIHGNAVPGKGLKIKLTNQPVELANTVFTFSSSDCAIAGADATNNDNTARADSLIWFFISSPVGSWNNCHGHGRALRQRSCNRAKEARRKATFALTADYDLPGIAIFGNRAKRVGDIAVFQ